MDTFKIKEYNPTCKVFSFFNRQNSIFHSYKGIGNRQLVTVVVDSLTAWIDVVTINQPAQEKFLF